MDNTVVVTGCDGFLRLIRAADGYEVAKIDLGTYVASSPAYKQNRLYVGTFSNKVLAVDLEEQNIHWEYKHSKQNFPFYSSPAVSNDLVVIGGRDKMIHGIDRTTGEARWTFLTRSKIDSSPLIAGQVVFIAEARGVVFGLDLESGDLLWKYNTGSGIQASPAVSDSRLVISTMNGIVYCLGNEGSPP